MKEDDIYDYDEEGLSEEERKFLNDNEFCKDNVSIDFKDKGLGEVAYRLRKKYNNDIYVRITNRNGTEEFAFCRADKIHISWSNVIVSLLIDGGENHIIINLDVDDKYELDKEYSPKFDLLDAYDNCVRLSIDVEHLEKKVSDLENRLTAMENLIAKYQEEEEKEFPEDDDEYFDMLFGDKSSKE